MVELLNKYGIETVNAIINEMYDYSERITRLAIEKIPDGTWTAEDYIDSNGVDLDKPILKNSKLLLREHTYTGRVGGSMSEAVRPPIYMNYARAQIYNLIDSLILKWCLISSKLMMHRLNMKENIIDYSPLE